MQKELDYLMVDLATLFILVTSLKEMSTPNGFNIISCESSSKHEYFQILNHFYATPISREIAPTATVLTKQIGKNVAIGHHCYIGSEVVIADDVIIGHNVVIENSVRIGKRTVIQPGVVIGCDGYGYSRDICGDIAKVPHFGGVVMGEDVEVGANTYIGRGTLDDTVIESGSKIGRLCIIGHNVHIKERVMLGGGSITCGGSTFEKDSYLAPGAKIFNQVSIGENTVVGLGAIVTQNVESNKIVTPSAARLIRDNTGVNKGING